MTSPWRLWPDTHAARHTGSQRAGGISFLIAAPPTLRVEEAKVLSPAPSAAAVVESGAS